jgi:hypothetical protein
MKNNFYLLILLIVIVISFLLFNDKGNALAKPHLESFLNEQLDEGQHVTIEAFSLDLNQLHVTMLYNETSTVEVVGSYSLLMQNFDLNYKLALKDFKYKNIELKELVEATGHAVGNYSVSEKELRMAYDINVSDLTKLQPITKQKLYGSMLLRGEVNQVGSETTITGKTEELDGELNFQVNNGHFTMQMKELSVEKVMAMLHYPSVFKASVNGEGEYNLTQERGLLTSTLVDAQLLPNDFTELVKNFNGLDLSKETFKESNLTATIKKEHIDFDFVAKNSKTFINVSPAFIDSKKNYIDAHYTIEVENKDVGGKIKGDISSPHISIDSSKFIQREVNRAIDKHSDKLKDLGLGEKEQKKVKEFLNNLFH